MIECPWCEKDSGAEPGDLFEQNNDAEAECQYCEKTFYVEISMEYIVRKEY